MEIPRPEYPRPQFVRSDWLCLNGEWQFEIDSGDSGFERGLVNQDLKDKIIVPFCPESVLSGIQHTDFMNVVWYRRQVTIPEAWAGRQVLLHFQAVDYDTTVWVNGIEVGRHRGGFTPFTCDLKGVVSPGEAITITVRARDFNNQPQPRGKQSQRYENFRCMYTRTTGIWQTVWMEPVAETYLSRPRLTPDATNGIIHLVQPLSGDLSGAVLRARLSDQQGEVCLVCCNVGFDMATHLLLFIPEERRHYWAVGDPFLYDLEIELLNPANEVIDRFSSYAGLRSIAIEGRAIKINGQPVFQRLVLDQGFYHDGILTAPSDEALHRDIELSQAAGFNGARLHQKVFEERFLYHADRLGYLVWGEFADWGCGGFGPQDDHQQPGATYITQWLEALARDYSHHSIIGWCPLNETAQSLSDRITVLDDVTRGMVLAAKAMDSSRPILDVSGYSHRVPDVDVYDCHDYEQDPEIFRQHHAHLAIGQPFYNGPKNQPWSIPYRNQPFIVSEFGGAWWKPDLKPGETSWGYGRRPATIEEFYQRFAGLCDTLLDHPSMFGYCYTQLTDVYQEQNGIYDFNRQPKFDIKRLAKIQQRKAAIE